MSLTKVTYSMIESAPYNVIDYGADKTGTLDSTSAIQAAITAATQTAGRGNTVYFPAGIYKVSSTITVPSTAQGISMIGEGQTRTMIYRNTDYGNTFVFGSSSSAAIESSIISNLFFYHDYGGYENGQLPSTLVNKPTSGAHLNLWNPIRFSIRNCTVWNMPTNILFNGGSKTEVVSCNFRGSWDNTATQAQVTTESILLTRGSAASSLALPTDIHIRDNDFTGYLSAARSITYGTVTVTQNANVGPLAMIRITASEVIQISGGNMGGANDAAVSIQPQNGITCLSIFISGVFFDGNRLAGIRCTNGGGTGACVGLSITNNIFIGQNNSENAIWFGNLAADPVPSVEAGIIANNNIGNYVCTAIVSLRANGLNINNNIIRDYNTLAGFNADAFRSSGIYLTSGNNKIKINANQIGGGFGFESYTGTATNACRYGVYIESGVTYYDLIGNVIPTQLVGASPISDNGLASDIKYIVSNDGYNSGGSVVAPSIPSSGVGLLNPYGTQAYIHVFGGTVSGISVNGTAIAATTDVYIFIGPKDTITLTYSVTPSWAWWIQ